LKKYLTLLIFCIIFIGCKSKKDKFIDDFGVFINQSEAYYKEYTDEEWEITILEYLDFESKLSEMKFDEIELNQIKDYKLRFKKIKIKRDPLNNILEIFK